MPYTEVTGNQFTVSGNEITDVVRATNVEGDGLSVVSSYGIYQAATNYCKNGGAETNTTGYSKSATVTITRDTGEHKFGAASLKVVAAGGAANEGAWYDTDTALGWAAGTHVKCSAWIKGAGGEQLRVYAQIVNTDASSTTSADTLITLTAGWAKYEVAAFDVAAGKTANYVRFFVPRTPLGVTLAYTCYVDGVQIEPTNYSTPYKHTNGGSATRAAARVQAPATLLDETQGWIAHRIRWGFPSTALPAANAYLHDLRDDADNLLGCYLDIADRKVKVARKAGGTGSTADSAAQTFAAGDKATVVAAWTATAVKISVNGGVFVSVANANIPTLAATLADLGSQAGTSHLNGDVLWSAFGTGTLTDADAATINAFDDTEPSISLLPSTALVSAIWSADTSDYLQYDWWEYPTVVTTSGPPDPSIFRVIHKDHSGNALGECSPNKLSFGMALNDVGYINYELDRNHPLAKSSLTSPYLTDWELWVNDVPLMGGLHTAVSRADSDTNAISIAGKDWLHYLEKRQYPFNPDPDHVSDYWFYKDTTDVFTIVEDMLDAVLAMPYSASFSYDNGECGQTFSYNIPMGDEEDIASKLKTLAGGSPGFDFEISYDRIINLYSPHKETTSNLIFELGRNLADNAWTDNGPTSTHTLGLATGGSISLGVMLESTLQPYYRRLDSTTNFEGVFDSASLTTQTIGQQLRDEKPIIELPLTVVPDAEFWADARPGIIAKVVIPDPYKDINDDYRIVGIECMPTDEGDVIVTVTVDDQTISL